MESLQPADGPGRNVAPRKSAGWAEPGAADPSEEPFKPGPGGRHRAAAAAAPHRRSPVPPEPEPEPKPPKPGRYVCDYCGRACAKPSVLKKHIRSHTGERPYPCLPCGFSFKTKSNLYKHRKSHAHAAKAGAATGADPGSVEGELFSDGEQSTDTDEDAAGDPLLLLDSPLEGADATAVKVLSLIAQRKDPPPAPLAPPALQSCSIKQKLALRLSEKRGGDAEHNLSLPSQSSKGSTDSGYFSRSESAEHQAGPPNANAKSYQEIMFGKCYRPSPKQAAASPRGVSRVFTQEKDAADAIRINSRAFVREEAQEPASDGGPDLGPLTRSNSMPTGGCLATPPALRGSHSFDERSGGGGMRRLRRQAAIELSPHDADAHGRACESGGASGSEMENLRHAADPATRKRRKGKREEEDGPGRYHPERAEDPAEEPLSRTTSVIQHTNALHRPESCDGERRALQLAPRLVRQPNIQVPEIRVTVEPDPPDRPPEPPAKELERHPVEEFQWPQRSETLAQFPPEKLPPKKKRLRLTDLEHSSGESSFESACTSLSRSPSQDSNLSYGSALSCERDEKAVSPARQDELGRALELLAVPGYPPSAAGPRQPHEMRRSSSEQAPCHRRRELPEARSVSFDYGSLSPRARPEPLGVGAEPAVPPYPLVPVRIQTHVPCFGSLTYTSVSPILECQLEGLGGAPRSRRPLKAEDPAPAKLQTGIPLSLTSRTISTTNASSGASKRMLSPGSSLDLLVEAKQQKRVKEERMFGQIVAELSAVELGEDPGEAMEEAGPDGRAPGSGLELRISAKMAAFPSLRTSTGVSWCFLRCTQPSCSSGSAPLASVYASWCVSARNPNPPELSTGAALALLRSRQRGGRVVYTMAAMCQPDTGKLVSSLVVWRQALQQRKAEPKEGDVSFGKKPKEAGARLRSAKDEWKEKEACGAPAPPTRVKIFEGGFKSNEDYVYVRGRGRGKYICEECGIRCKKPSMLKKHIRTHTDLRPFVCRVCNFAFKTKGNLTKHMKSKAHLKKCLELGVSVTPEEAETQDHADDGPRDSKMAAAKHQFSDAEDSDGMDEDELEEDEEDEDEGEGEATPTLRSRSTSPLPARVASPAVTASGAAHGPKAVDEDSLPLLTPDQAHFLFDPYSSCLLSPGWESPLREPSPSRLRHPSPRRELSPRGRSLPRWDASPLRPASPGFSPVRHLSPGALERPLSPALEAAVRGRQRVVLRAVSPRRGSHPHRGPADRGHADRVRAHKMEATPTFDMELDQRSHTGPSQQNLLSHLPLHSQQQAFRLLPVAPIGGPEALHTPPPSVESLGCSSRDGSVPESRPGDEEPSRDPGQEESVRTCLEAIESLKITAEEPR